jgi:hypothetical protein
MVTLCEQLLWIRNGTGNGSGWGLNGRSISSRGKEVQKCNEFGTVVVQITVNRNGNVIAAKYTKEQQIRILLGRTSIGTQSTDGNPMPMLLRRKLALLPLISN